MNNLSKALFIFSLYLPAVSLANSACDKPKNDFDGLYCLNKIYQEADKELNENYKMLVSKLDKDGKAKLKQRQLEWMKDRNDNCSKHDGREFFVNLNCATKTTVERSQFLQNRIRECNSSGCLNSRL